MTGDNRSVQIGPNNSLSPQLTEHIKKANIPLDNKLLNSYQSILCKSLSVNNANTFSLLKPEDFNILQTPKSELQNSPNLKKLLADPDYIKKVEERYVFYQEFKNRIAQKGLNKDIITALHSVYQGSFKEWMTTKGATKSLNDLVKMI